MTQPTAEAIAAARAGFRKWGIPASVTLAQWAQESGWGKRMPPGSNNPFGIKARIHEGVIIDPYVIAGTDENFAPGTTWRGPQPFRKFATIAAAFDYHDELLKTAPAYASARSKLPDPFAFAHALAKVYATDPDYGDEIEAIIRGSNLTRYDA